MREIVRLDWVIYLVVGVMAILVLAGLFGLEADHAIVGMLATFATGIITGVLTYLRLTARSEAKKRKESPPEDTSDGKA